jgi:hypothetical protein
MGRCSATPRSVSPSTVTCAECVTVRDGTAIHSYSTGGSMSTFQRIKPGHYQTADGRFEVRYDEPKRQWFVVGNDEDAESALRATAHLRGYPRLGDADSWVLATVYPYLRDEHGEGPKRGSHNRDGGPRT